MKKTIAALLLAAALLASLSVTALARGHGGKAKSYPLCTTANCNTVGDHWHNGVCYAGHTLGDGHTYHKLCGEKDCTKTGCHNHNGVTYMPHANGDGHSYHGRGGGHCR